MTLFGKLLVMFNLAFAVVLAAWSFNIYANGVDWTDSKSKGTPPVPIGQYAIRAAKVDALWKDVAPAQSDWLNERAKLANEESRLVAERVWYDKEIRFVYAGPAKNKPLTAAAIAAKDTEQTIGGNKIVIRRGQVLQDAEGYPQMAPLRDGMGNPLQLQSLSEYNAQDEGILKELAGVMAAHVAQIADANALTDKIIGDKAKGVRGLQERIYDEEAKNAAALAEMKLVEPQLINTLVEAQLVGKRHNQMRKRIEELKKIKVAGK